MRDVEERMLDGNAAAGLLAQIFVPEMTTAVLTCIHCGAERPLGAAQLYIAAGFVLRCSGCSGVLMRVISGEERMFMDLTGLRRLEFRRPSRTRDGD